MKVPSRVTSGRDFVVCPECGRGELEARGHDSAECGSCGCGVEGAVL
jgi:ribosomal protein S27AE